MDGQDAQSSQAERANVRVGVLQPVLQALKNLLVRELLDLLAVQELRKQEGDRPSQELEAALSLCSRAAGRERGGSC